MSVNLINILAQYHDENGKPKGGQYFTVRADVSLFMYAPAEVVVDTLQKMIDERMVGYAGKHTYVEHEIIFHEPMELKDNFEEVFESVCAAIS